MDPTVEQPIPREPQAAHEVQESLSFEEAGNRLRAFIEGEALGTVKSKAFCDFVDEKSFLESWMRANKPGTPHGEEDSKTYTKDSSAIGETIRQRWNELPGYIQARTDMSRLYMDIVLSSPTESQDSRETRTGRANSFMRVLKMGYLDGKLTPPTPNNP